MWGAEGLGEVHETAQRTRGAVRWGSGTHLFELRAQGGVVQGRHVRRGSVCEACLHLGDHVRLRRGQDLTHAEAPDAAHANRLPPIVKYLTSVPGR